MSRKLTRLIGRATISAAALVLLCIPQSLAADVDIPSGLSRDQLFGTALRAAKWNRLQIEVCWDNPEMVSEEYRGLTKQAVVESWEAKSSVRFTGWGRCTGPTDRGLHIVIDDRQPYTESVGKYLDARPGGMHLNFNFSNWRPSCASTQDQCARSVIVHEFGHALGFTHEQLTEGVPAECSSEPRDIVGDYLVTRYDLSSVMALCNPHWNGDGKLSGLDIQAVRRVYGA